MSFKQLSLLQWEIRSVSIITCYEGQKAEVASKPEKLTKNSSELFSVLRLLWEDFGNLPILKSSIPEQNPVQFCCILSVFMKKISELCWFKIFTFSGSEEYPIGYNFFAFHVHRNVAWFHLLTYIYHQLNEVDADLRHPITISTVASTSLTHLAHVNCIMVLCLKLTAINIQKIQSNLPK